MRQTGIKCQIRSTKNSTRDRLGVDDGEKHRGDDFQRRVEALQGDAEDEDTVDAAFLQPGSRVNAAAGRHTATDALDGTP
ncbi:MAG: hypothetical protein K8F58_02130 [Bauldia sp.]|nr:hypothetical protein [Bauldia sp.]